MIAREGLPFILIALAIASTALWGATRWNSLTLTIIATLFALVTIAVTMFFRDPDRSCADEPGLVVSPADGTILSIDTLSNHPVTGAGTLKISMFLSVANVHVNRVPISGRVDYVKYVPGKFLVAYLPKASEDNEHTEIGMTDSTGRKVVFKQIAGTIARRIVCRIKGGEELAIGSRFGLIRFGSRMEVFLPAGSAVTVATGDKVRGGETVIGRLTGHQSQASSKSGHMGANTV
ncbi:MAG: phosphatidylserine decarboxylase family protein [candidate division Zixibacteria bacterium]|nr:phosphatidylserine decarboxylase family protein [candidate division Zixibacteria bacterium]